MHRLACRTRTCAWSWFEMERRCGEALRDSSWDTALANMYIYRDNRYNKTVGKNNKELWKACGNNVCRRWLNKRFVQNGRYRVGSSIHTEIWIWTVGSPARWNGMVDVLKNPETEMNVFCDVHVVMPNSWPKCVVCRYQYLFIYMYTKEMRCAITYIVLTEWEE